MTMHDLMTVGYWDLWRGNCFASSLSFCTVSISQPVHASSGIDFARPQSFRRRFTTSSLQRGFSLTKLHVSERGAMLGPSQPNIFVVAFKNVYLEMTHIFYQKHQQRQEICLFVHWSSHIAPWLPRSRLLGPCTWKRKRGVAQVVKKPTDLRGGFLVHQPLHQAAVCSYSSSVGEKGPSDCSWFMIAHAHIRRGPLMILMLLTFYLPAAFWPAKAVTHYVVSLVFWNLRFQGHAHLSKHPEPRGFICLYTDCVPFGICHAAL